MSKPIDLKFNIKVNIISHLKYNDLIDKVLRNRAYVRVHEKFQHDINNRYMNLMRNSTRINLGLNPT